MAQKDKLAKALRRMRKPKCIEQRSDWRAWNEFYEEATFDMGLIFQRVIKITLDGIVFGCSIAWQKDKKSAQKAYNEGLFTDFHDNLRRYRAGEVMPYQLDDGRVTWCKQPGIVGLPGTPEPGKDSPCASRPS